MSRRSRLLTDVLRQPDEVLELTPPLWDLLLRQARVTHLTGHLAWRIDHAGLMRVVPVGPRRHLQSALQLVAQQRLTLRRLIGQLRSALAESDLPLRLLAGGAYLSGDLPLAHGRLTRTLALQVAPDNLAAAEATLECHGWRRNPAAVAADRLWCREEPGAPTPASTIEPRHPLLPDTLRLSVAGPPLFDDWRAATAEPGVQVLAPPDMVLHAAWALFENRPDGNLDFMLRDLVDLDLLLRHHGRTQGFWPALVSRSQALRLQRPLFYALRYARRLLDTPCPKAVVRAGARHAPAWPVKPLMDLLAEQVLRPRLPRHDGTSRRLAHTLLDLRSHWLHLPPLDALRRTGESAWQRLAGGTGAAQADAQLTAHGGLGPTAG